MGTRRGTRRRSTVAVVALSVLVGAALVVPSMPAAAHTVDTDYSRVPPVTWVDELGRQYLVTEVLVDLGPTFQLVVARNTPAGDPDPTWGSYQHPAEASPREGLRALDLPPPEAGLELEPLIAASDEGTLTTTWRPSSCNPARDDCERWYAQFDATGAPIAPPVDVGVSERPADAHRDGSFTTYGADGYLGWRGADGTERGAPTLIDGSVRDTTVDRAGRLLVATTDRTVRRWPTGGPADLEIPVTTCAPDVMVFVAAAEADDGFATICARGETTSVEVERRDADGSIQWRTAAPDFQPDGQISIPYGSVVDAEDRVWLGGTGQRAQAPGRLHSVFVQSFTEDGPEGLAYWRDSPSHARYEYGDARVHDLRGGPGGTLAVADDMRCCKGNGFEVADGEAYAELVAPLPMVQPMCAVTGVVLERVGPSGFELGFDRCNTELGPRDELPLGYRVTVAAADAAVATIDVAVAPGDSRAVVPLALGAAAVSTISVRARNQAGEGPPVSVHAVAPFASVEAFVSRQYADLAGSAPAGEPAATARALRAGADPVAWLANRLADGLAGQHAEPVSRLYRTYFQRDPDPDGFDYWIRRRLAGARLAHTSDTFAASSEFDRTYGALTNRQFVAALYRNAFGRHADPSGLTFWTGRIDRGRNSRGQVVLHFSESTEGMRRTASVVEPIGAAWYLLGRLPTSAERAQWSTFDDPRRQSAGAILVTDEYAARVSG